MVRFIHQQTYFMQVWAIKYWLRDHDVSSDRIIRKMVHDMTEKYDKYWEDFSDILAIAVILDLRRKFAFLEYFYNTLDPLTSKSNLAISKRRWFSFLVPIKEP